MTIPGFWNELKERNCLDDIRCSFPDYAQMHYTKHEKRLRVGIDMFQWIFEHSSNVSTNGENLPELDTEIHVIVSGITSKLRYLHHHNVDFVVVIDGKLKLDKNRKKIAQIKYNTDNHIFEDWYKRNLKLIKHEKHINQQKCVCALVDVLEAWDIDFIHATGDAETELARLNVSGIVDAIISNDADAFAYGATVVLRNFSKFSSDLPASSRKLDNTSSRNNTTLEYNVTPVDTNILNKVNLNADKIMFIACCQGDDYSNGAKGLGIKKAWALATGDSNHGFDVVKRFKSIYVSNETKMILQGKLPYDRNTRINLLKEFEQDLTKFLRTKGREFLKYGHNTEVKLPSDFIIASHYYPHFTEYLFIFNRFSTGVADPDGMPKETLKNLIFPQPLSIIEEKDGVESLIIKRGNNRHKNVGKTVLNLQTLEHQTTLNGSMNKKPYNWISGLNYETLLKWMQTSKNKKKGMEYLADVLGRAYFWKALILFDELNLKETDMFIKTEKSVKMDNSKDEQTLYQLKFKPRNIFKKALGLSDVPLDENLNKVEDEIAYVWVPRYYFEIEKNGREIFERYLVAKSSPRKTPKSTPRKRKTPTQKSTLDILSLSSKSPVKILPRHGSKLLQVSGASIVDNNKRNCDDANGSPKKRIKTVESIGELNIPVSSILKEPFEEDAEVSKVLESSDYIGSSFIIDDDNMDGDFNQFYKNSKQADVPETGKVSNKLNREEKQNVSELPLFKVQKDNKHSKLAVSRGISLMDSMTKLPSVPGELVDKKMVSNTVKPRESIIGNFEEFSDLEDDTFSSHGSMDLLFPEDKILRLQAEAKKKKDESNDINSNFLRSLPTDFSNDTFSTHGSMDILFGGVIEDDNEVHKIKTENEKPLISESQNGQLIIIDSETELLVSEEGTMDVDILTPVKKRLESEIIDGLGKPTLTVSKIAKLENSIMDTMPLPGTNPTNNMLIANRKEIDKIIDSNSQKIAHDGCSLPSDFDGSEIMLAENTDDEMMWVIPPKEEKSERYKI